MEKQYYNKIVGDFKVLRKEISDKMRVINSPAFQVYLRLSSMDSTGNCGDDYVRNNPADFVLRYLNELQLLGEKYDFDVFGEDSYIKFLYVSFFEHTLLKMIYCLNEIEKFYDLNIFLRAFHFQDLYNLIGTYINSFEMIRSFSPNDIFKIYFYLIREGDPVSFFKNGMFSSLLYALEDDANLLKLKFSQDIFEFVQSLVTDLEIEIANDEIDKAKFDAAIESASAKYCVDFASLDHGFSFVWGENNGEDNKSD